MTELRKLSEFARSILESVTPVLSGNMQQHIAKSKLVDVSFSKITFCIEAPFYDLPRWEKEGVIVHTGKSYKGITDYANWVNKSGAFGKKNASMHWVNRALFQAAQMIPDAEIIMKLEM